MDQEVTKEKLVSEMRKSFEAASRLRNWMRENEVQPGLLKCAAFHVAELRKLSGMVCSGGVAAPAEDMRAVAAGR